MKWVTRERPKIDRIACPWLVARFIDPAPEFLYVPADRVMAEAAEEAAGLLALSRGLSLNFPDDHEMLAQGMVVYDALYAHCAGAPIRQSKPPLKPPGT